MNVSHVLVVSVHYTVYCNYNPGKLSLQVDWLIDRLVFKGTSTHKGLHSIAQGSVLSLQSTTVLYNLLSIDTKALTLRK